MTMISNCSAMLDRLFRRHRAMAGTPAVQPTPSPTNALFNYYCEFDAVGLMRAFEAKNVTPEPGYIANFLGLMIEPRVMPSILQPMVGKVEGFPWPGNWHADIAEWAAALRSVEQANGTYRIVELGCGWGCWLNNMGVAARRKGLEVDLIGIEGDAVHLESARRTLELNGFRDGDFRLVHGVAAPRTGTALFPVNGAPGENWGHVPIMYPDEATRMAALRKGSYAELTCYTLSDVAEGREIDLLHIDIQGAEFSFVEQNFGDIEHLVKRVLIGTHSRWLEGALHNHFLSREWAIEMDRPAICELVGGQPDVRIDGVTSFRNPRFPAPAAIA